MLVKLRQLQQNHPNIAICYAIISPVSLAFMQICLKTVTKFVTPFHALTLRGFFLLVINSVFIHRSQLELNIKNRQTFILLMQRVAFSMVTLILFLYPLNFIPASITNALFNISPIMIHFLNKAITQHQLNKVHIILTIICFIGVLLIIKPSFLFGQTHAEGLIYYIMAFLSAFTRSFSMIYLHKLKDKVNNLIVLHYNYIIQNLFFAIFWIFENEKKQQMQEKNLYFYLGVIGMVMFAFMTQFSMTKAIFLKKPSYAMPFSYITIVLAAIFDLFLFNEELQILTILGILLTSVGLLSKVLIKEKQ